MSARVCAILRRDRGRLVSRVRLVGPRSAETWSVPDAAPGAVIGPGSAAVTAERDAAAWVATRLGENTRLAAVCVDVDGALCAWMSAPTREAKLVASLARSGPATPEADAAFSTSSRGGSSALAAYAGSELDASVHVLGTATALADEPEADANSKNDKSKPAKSKKPGAADAGTPRAARMPVLAIGDLPARLFIDGLDTQGVSVDAVLTLWHAAAMAWDPSAKTPSAAGNDADLANAPTTGVVLVDQAADQGQGRLIWCWSVGGTLLAGGSMRLARAKEGESVVVGAAEAARLATEWLAWSVQLGRTPSRVVAVAPEGADGELAAFGQALGAAASGCVVDLAVHADPLGVTLTRLAEKLDDAAPLSAQAGLASLATRPGGAQRRMHHWLALAIIGVAAMLGVVAWRLGANVGAARSEAIKQEERWRELLKEVFPDALAARGGEFDKLRTQYMKRDKELRPPEAKENARPILQQLEALSFVLGDAEYELNTLQIPSGGQVVVEVKVKTVEQGEELRRALDSIAGSQILRWTESYTNEGAGENARVRCRFSGTWVPLPAKPAAAAPAEGATP